MTAQLDSGLFWLTAGDPGPGPAPAEEPACEGWCVCALTSSRVPACDGPAPAPAPAEPVFWDVPGQARPPAGPSLLLEDLRRSLDAVAAAGPLSGSRADTAVLLVLAERSRALALRELAQMDATGGHLRPGARSTTASWLRRSGG